MTRKSRDSRSANVGLFGVGGGWMLDREGGPTDRPMSMLMHRYASLRSALRECTH